jgi:protein-L-isoaspartate O-methyltransferase
MSSHTSAAAPRASAVAAPLSTAPAESSGPEWLIWNLALLILVSAFLLFQVQPLISKFILPWFGGSPAVWTTCMLFFQTLLFFGYAYAHLTLSVLPGRWQAIVHLGLIVAAVCLLPVTPADSWKPAPGMDPTWRILGLLTCTVGLPYFVLSSTGPLGQAWFSWAFRQRSPYRLYALSNVGSLAALLTYPFLFEPAFSAEIQARLWSWTFGLFGLLCAAAAIWIWRNRAGHHRPAKPAAATNGEVNDVVAAEGLLPRVEGPMSAPTAADAPTWLRRALWMGLPACASLMLLATTNHVCQNVATVPLLWVVPLSLYLLTFIICFDHERWYRRGPYAAAAALAVFFASGGSRKILNWLGDELPVWFPSLGPKFDLSLNFVEELAMYFAALFLVCMMCHGELVRLRPKPRYLTEFYLLISAGGAAGGIFVGLIAPHIFNSFLEWNLGLIVSFVLAGGLLAKTLFVRASVGKAPAEVVGDAPPRSSGVRRVAAPAVVLAWVVALVFVVYWQIDNATPPDYALMQRRNFFGQVRVNNIDEVVAATGLHRHYHQFKSGRISHGRQWVSDDIAKRMEPTSYYAPISGVGHAMTFFKDKPGLRIGVVGLGCGCLAAYAAQPGAHVTFYEINPEVKAIAENPAYFTYLQDLKKLGGDYEIKMGDARLSMEAEDPQHFDVLALDAFSGDAPPVHLLTREAFKLYGKHVNPGGIIAVNIQNMYVDMAPVVKAAADEYGYDYRRIWSDEDPNRLLNQVDWMLLTNNKEFLEANPTHLKKGVSPDIHPLAWTDHYSNLWQLLMTK